MVNRPVPDSAQWPAPLLLVLAGYLIAAVAYVFITPPWQAPDEPAHYNYVRHLVEEARLPVLEVGDYPAAYLEEVKAAGFPPDASIAPIRYESHQPPLYYLLAAPVLASVGGDSVTMQMHALRLFSVFLGAADVLLAHRLGRILWPRRPGRALALAGVVAFLPMRTAVTAAVSNDVLAEVLVGAAALVSLRLLLSSRRPYASCLMPLGVILGLCLLTKTSAYIALPLAVVALLWAWYRQDRPRPGLGRRLAAIIVPAALLYLPFYMRNMAVYGLADPLGLARHDAVVVGQLRTSDYLAGVGLMGGLRQGLSTTFRSFWGIFGWMGVPMHEPTYLALALVCALALVGLILAGLSARRRPPGQRAILAAGFLALWGTLSILGVIWYNLKFVQFQGRYLFTALPVWSAALVVGLGWARRRAVPLSVALIGLGIATLALGEVTGDRHRSSAALLGLAGVSLLGWDLLARRLPEAAGALPLSALWLLDLAGAIFYVNRFL